MKWSILGFVLLAVGCGGIGTQQIEEQQSAYTYVQTMPNGAFVARPNPVQSSPNGTGSLYPAKILTPTMCSYPGTGNSGMPRWWQTQQPPPGGDQFSDWCNIPSDRYGGAAYDYGTYVMMCFHPIGYAFLTSGENEWCEWFTLPNVNDWVIWNNLSAGSHQCATCGYPDNQWEVGAVYMGNNSIRCKFFDQAGAQGNLLVDIGWDTSHEHTTPSNAPEDTNHWWTDYGNVRQYTQGYSTVSVYCKHYQWNE